MTSESLAGGGVRGQGIGKEAQTCELRTAGVYTGEGEAGGTDFSGENLEDQEHEGVRTA